jgi:hypothetical protein
MGIDTTVRHWCKTCERATSSTACSWGCGNYTVCIGCRVCVQCGMASADKESR